MIENKKYKSGFTLLEMLVVIGIISIIIIITSMFVGNSWKSYQTQSDALGQVDAGASALRNFEKNTRAASKIAVATPNQLKFYRFFDLTSIEPDQVRYFVIADQFKVGITHPSGTAPNVTYLPSNEETKLVINNIKNTGSLFNYFNGTNIEIVNPDVAAIRMIQLKLQVGSSKVGQNGSVTVETRVNLRNVKDNL